jgi:hypothetical protein
MEFKANNPYTASSYQTLKDLEDEDPQSAEQYKEFAVLLIDKEWARQTAEEKAYKRLCQGREGRSISSTKAADVATAEITIRGGNDEKSRSREWWQKAKNRLSLKCNDII